MEGYLPEHQIDHRNRIRFDNKWANLRHVTQQCNMKNCKLSSRNKSGITGVTWIKRDNIWRSGICSNGKIYNLGSFKNLKNAVIARWKGEKKYDFPNCNTASTTYQYLKNENFI